MLKAVMFYFLFTAIQSTIYNLNVKSIDGKKIDLASFKGKKILIVNIATESQYASQLTSLEHLQEKYKDSLVVIGVPSNSFGKENKSDLQVKEKLQGYNISFLIAEKMQVIGESKSSLFVWLTKENGNMRKEVQGDFQKYLISSKGEMMGYFIPAIDPMSDIIQRAIEGRRNIIK